MERAIASVVLEFPESFPSHLKCSHPAEYEEMLKREAEKENEVSQSMAKRKCIASPPSGQLTLEGSIQQVQPYPNTKAMR